MSSNILLALFICPSICGWLVILKVGFVPKPANNSFQNLEVSFASLFDTIFFGTPCNLTTSLMNTYAMSLAEKVDLTGMKCATFVNLSTITIMESCYIIVFGKLVMKCMEMTSHFHSRISIGCSSSPGCLHFAFTCWQSEHRAMNSATSLFKFGQ